MLSASATPASSPSTSQMASAFGTVVIQLTGRYRIMKVAVLVPLWSVFSLLSIIHPQAQVYLFPWLDLFQANALAAFFLLVCDYISPSSGQRELFFVGMTISKNKRQKKKGKGKNGLQWYLVCHHTILSHVSANQCQY